MDIEYCVYDVTPDVSIDFVSFTTEESEGKELHIAAQKTFLIYLRRKRFLFTLEVKSHPSQYNMLLSLLSVHDISYLILFRFRLLP